tara:strand:+ start:2089 stop:2646 length:558 start_codon:yes stop_codon:yes gene_type:complete
MIHPHTELRFVSPQVGYGVFATRRIPRGTVTWILDPLDQLFTPSRVAELGRAYQELLLRYAYQDREGNTVLSWDHGRFVNHSCDSSTASGCDDEFEIALRDIEVGEEITDDYAELETDETFPCACGAKSCRGVVGPVGREVARAGLLSRVAEALLLAPGVPQPLVPFARNPELLAESLSPRLASV